MLRRLHPTAGIVGFITILTFWTSTVITELSGSRHAVIVVKQIIPWFLPVLIIALATTGASGFRMAAGADLPLIAAKRARMPFIAGNGILVLIPSAIVLDILASGGHFSLPFYLVQALELLAGATNLTLMSLNVRDGLRLTGRLAGPRGDDAHPMNAGDPHHPGIR